MCTNSLTVYINYSIIHICTTCITNCLHFRNNEETSHCNTSSTHSITTISALPLATISHSSCHPIFSLYTFNPFPHMILCPSQVGNTGNGLINCDVIDNTLECNTTFYRINCIVLKQLSPNSVKVKPCLLLEISTELL